MRVDYRKVFPEGAQALAGLDLPDGTDQQSAPGSA